MVAKVIFCREITFASLLSDSVYLSAKSVLNYLRKKHVLNRNGKNGKLGKNGNLPFLPVLLPFFMD